MKRSGINRGTKALKAKTRIKPVSDKRRKHRASKAGQDAMWYMGQVKQLPCCICGSPGPNEAHHCISGRYSARKASDWHTVPLCAFCHRIGPTAIHNGKASWEVRNGPDTDYIEQTQIAILGKARCDSLSNG